jgi:heptosyltransferase-1
MKDPLRILIVRVGAMGDVLHAMPAVAALRRAAPDVQIGWAIEPKWSPLLRSSADALAHSTSMPLVDRVHLVPTKEWSKKPLSLATLHSVLALRSELREPHYDIAIDLQGSIRSSVIARMSGARCVLGSATPREPQARWLYHQRVDLQEAHVVGQAAEIVSAALDSPVDPATVALPVDPAAEQWCHGILLDRPPGPLVVLAPTAGWGAKEWPPERYGALARGLAERGCTVLVNASPFGADEVANHVVGSSSGAASAVPCTLPQLTALLRRASLLIAGDSGPLHLAAALSVSTVGIFGPTDPMRTAPWGSHSKVLRHHSSVTDHRRHREREAGLLQVRVEEVLAASEELLPPVHG